MPTVFFRHGASPGDAITSLPRLPWVAESAGDLLAKKQLIDQADDSEPIEWSEEDVVRLHCLLLDDLRALADPTTPLEEKFDTLCWIYTDREKDALPFSFATCLRVAGCSPLSTYPYFGNVHADDVRDLLQLHVRRWLKETLARYPRWVQDEITRNPQWAADRLARNPQWINEQLKRHAVQDDLFS